MKVLHISTRDNDGAGLCAVRISNSLRQIGVDSRVLVKCATSSSPYLDGIFSKRQSYLSKIYHKILRILNIYVYEEDILIKQSIELGSSFTRPTGNAKILSHPWVQEADIIHLHWVDDFFCQKEFFDKIDKPIVWTLHDEGLFYGTSHYHDLFDLNNKLERKYFDQKQEMVKTAQSLSLVFLSKYFMDKFGKTAIVSDKKIDVINNSVNFSEFYPRDKVKVREKLGITLDTVVLSFVASRIDDPHKGLIKLINIVKKLNIPKVVILAIGRNDGFIKDDYVFDIGPIYDCDRMSELLSASDLLVMPSLQEAFSQVPLEAMACGIPVVAFPVSGTEELIHKDNGVVCKGFEESDLLEGLSNALSTHYDHEKIRNTLKIHFAPEVIAAKYYAIYENIK